MSCITKLLEMKSDKEFLPVHKEIVIEGGGTYKDHEYLVVFTSVGHRCGYVALKHDEHERLQKDSKYKDCPDDMLQCHGGVTFYENTHAAKRLLPMPCDDFWVGFDAAHCYDAPDPVAVMKYFGDNSESSRHKHWAESLERIEGITHRTFEYMESECFKMIDQLVSWAVPA